MVETIGHSLSIGAEIIMWAYQGLGEVCSIACIGPLASVPSDSCRPARMCRNLGLYH